MRCSQTREWYENWIEDGSAPLPPGLREHLVACKDCRDLVALIQSSQTSPAAPADILERLRAAALSSGPSKDRMDQLRERIREMIRADLTPVKPMPSRGLTMLCVAGAILGGAAATAMVTGISGFHLLSVWQLAGLSALAICLLAAFSYVLSMLVSPGSPRRIRPPMTLLLVATAVFLFFGLFFKWDLQEGLKFTGMRCSRGVLLGSLPAFVLLCAFLHRGVVLEPVLAAVLIVAAAGAAALAASQLACPMQEASHLLIWHAGPWVLLVAVAGVGVWAFHRLR